MANDSVEATFAALVEFIAKKFLRGEVELGDLLGLDDDEVELIFLTGHYLYNFGKYPDALKIFGVLTMFRPFVSRYWRAAGAANQALKKYKEAIVAYDMALTSNQKDAISYTYRGESKIKLGDQEGGIDDLKMAVRVGRGAPQYSAWVQRSRTLLQVRGIDAESF